VEAALLEALEERPPVRLGLGDLGADAQDRAAAILTDAAGDQHGARNDGAVNPHFFIEGVEHERFDAADGPMTPLDQLDVQRLGRLRDLSGGDRESAHRLHDVAHPPRGDPVDIHLGGGQRQGLLAALAAIQGRGVEGHVPAHLGDLERQFAHAGLEPLGLEAVGVTPAVLRALVGRRAQCLFPLQPHGDIENRREHLLHAVEAPFKKRLQHGVHRDTFFFVGHGLFVLLLLVQHKDTRDPPSLTTRRAAPPRGERSLFPSRFALRAIRVPGGGCKTTTHQFKPNLQKENYTTVLSRSLPFHPSAAGSCHARLPDL